MNNETLGALAGLFSTMSELGYSGASREEAQKIVDESDCDELDKMFAMCGFNAGRAKMNLVLKALGREDLVDE